MNRSELLSKVDHTLLAPQATWAQIEALCKEAEEYRTASVCIPPSYVAPVREAFPELCICTVIGFPNGYNTTACKVMETKDAAGEHILKVIIETCLLTEEEKIRLCQIVSQSGADFIKTSTGFSKAGATAEDVRLMREHSAPEVRVKAAGGISSLADAELFLSLGADRLGTSRLIRLVREEKENKTC